MHGSITPALWAPGDPRGGQSREFAISIGHRASSRVKEIPRKIGCAVELWVVRHGETEDNKTRTIAGHNAGKLSALGITQVALAAGRETKREEEREREYNSALSIELQLFRLHSYS